MKGKQEAAVASGEVEVVLLLGGQAVPADYQCCRESGADYLSLLQLRKKRKKLREAVCKEDHTSHSRIIQAKFIYLYGNLAVAQRRFQTYILLWEWCDFSQWKLVDLSLLWLCKRIYTPCFHVKYIILIMCFAQEDKCINDLA